MAVRYNDLVTGAEVIEAAGNSLAKTKAADAPALEAAIADVTSLVESRLNRRLIVHPYRLGIKASAWCTRPDIVTTGLVELPFFRPSRTPVVEVYGYDNGLVAELAHFALHEGGYLVSFDATAAGVARPVNIDVFAGYRRAEQTLANLETAVDEAGAEPLDGLATLPPVLPYVVRRVAAELVLRRLTLAENKLLAGVTQSQTIAGNVIQTSRVDQAFEADLIDRDLGVFRRYNI